MTSLALKVLIAEHDENLKLVMESVFRQEGFDVSLASDGNQALQKVQEERPDFIILDRMIPVLGGLRLCKLIRTVPGVAETPIIMLSSNGGANDRILAFNVGADDYISSPFNIDELLARFKSLTRRQFAGQYSNTIRAGSIELDSERWLVSVNGVPVNLTIKEFRLLQELLQAKGRVLSRDTLLERVWGHEKELNLHTRTVDVHIGRLRGKLGKSGDQIITVRNIGYRVDISREWIRH